MNLAIISEHAGSGITRGLCGRTFAFVVALSKYVMICV
jgi:hypothetical protein